MTSGDQWMGSDLFTWPDDMKFKDKLLKVTMRSKKDIYLTSRSGNRAEPPTGEGCKANSVVQGQPGWGEVKRILGGGGGQVQDRGVFVHHML